MNVILKKLFNLTEKSTIGDWNEKFYIPRDIIWGLIKAVQK